MLPNFNDNFSSFKRQTWQTKNIKPIDILFMLSADDSGAFLQIVDETLNPAEVNYQAYSGEVRNILRQIESIREREAFVIEWGKEQGNLYLSEHEYLLLQLKNTDLLVNDKGKKLTFAEGEHQVIFEIKPNPENEKRLSVRPILSVNHQAIGWLNPISEGFLISGKTIYEISPLGQNFNRLDAFSSEIDAPDLEKYLSLLFSYLDNFTVNYLNFKVEELRETRGTEPALVFEKIDTDNALHLRITQILQGFDVEFLEQFDLHKCVEISELERAIRVVYIEQKPIEELCQNILKLLKKHIPKGTKKSNEIFQNENLFVVPQEVANNFIYNELSTLLLSWKLFGAEKLKTYQINTSQPKLDVSLSSGIDFLEGNATLDFDGEKISLWEALTQYRQKRYVELSDGSHALLNESYVQKLQRLFKKKKDKIEISFFDLPLVEELIEDRAASAVFQKSKSVFEGFNSLKTTTKKLPKVNATLRPYQQYGYQWLSYLREKRLGGCLADDMGLGKTIQTITLLSEIYPKEKLPTLVIMPKSLLFNWRNEVLKFNPKISTYMYYADTRNVEDAVKSNLIFTTYAMLRIDIELFKNVDFHYVILDESQNIKNMQSKTTKAVLMLKSKHKLALSGTPIENNLGELYSLFRFLNPAMFGSVQNFNDNYLIPIQKNRDVDAILELRKKIYPFILRRLKSEVLTELPDKIEQTLYVEMSEPQAKLYEQRRVFYQEAIKQQITTSSVERSQFFIFQAFNELRQIASLPETKSDGKIASPKLELLAEQMLDAIANGHKVLVFVNYLAAIELVEEVLEKAAIDFVSMTGSTRDRQKLVDRFQNDLNCKAFVMTLKTGGTGLNLTAADMVFIFDPWWNVAAENQAIDRTHRFGQTRKVTAYKLIAQNTIEEKILQLQEQKKQLFDDVISADAASVKSLSEDDINYLLK
jgi:SNF2 family DNA or RNA helicase